VTGNVGGNPFHIDMTVDQSLSFRPVVGLHRYETPVGGLFLSGSGTHPGGGVTGMPGYNTAATVLANRRNGHRPGSRPLRARAHELALAARALRRLEAQV
jgi:phytoene dehydrogenase-like protein